MTTYLIIALVVAATDAVICLQTDKRFNLSLALLAGLTWPVCCVLAIYVAWRECNDEDVS